MHLSLHPAGEMCLLVRNRLKLWKVREISRFSTLSHSSICSVTLVKKLSPPFSQR